jgi:hypothetical protein
MLVSVWDKLSSGKSTYLADIAKVAVCGLGSMHEAGCDAKTLQRCDSLPADKTALAYTTNNNLSSSNL